jgi:hypothetical protein
LKTFHSVTIISSWPACLYPPAVMGAVALLRECA